MEAQINLVKPYLQLATPTSVVIMWETDVNTESQVLYGLTESLESQVFGTSITTLGNTILHTVSLTGLTSATRYYYKAITGLWKSDVYDFVTPPLRESEAGFNMVLMSDMQKDGGNPNIFSNLINTSLLPYISSNYGTPLSDHLQMAVLPGDLVDNGNNYLQWKNDFFNPGEVLWRSVPSYPALGNHEVNSQNYFNYYTLPANGTPGYLEHWYSHDYSNVRVLSFDTNGPYRIPAQLSWLDSMLVLSCQDTFIDFVFAQMHHPHKSELWIPGEIDYTGDIIERLEAFSDSCGKPTVHFFGHTHAYSRGQSRDHDHLWVNVATSGGNIDYWGEFENQDYDEFIVSQDEYGFVMVEVTAGANPKFVLKRLSFGDQYNPGGNVQTDIVTVRLNNNPPTRPVALFPHASDTVSPFCLTIKADGFSDVDGDEHGASHWQVSTDSANFSNPVFDSWKQYENWYNEVDLQANDDLTDEEVSNLPTGSTLWWRVRYRDKSLEWSPWSTHTRFVTRVLDTLSSNLVINPDAESGTIAWTPTIGVIESLTAGQCDGITPYEGQKYFAVGALCEEHPFASAYQDIDVNAYTGQIDSSDVLVHYGAHLADWANTDEPSFALQFRNAGGQVIGSTDTIRHQLSTWTLKENVVSVPEGTRTIRYIIMGTRFSGVDNDSYMDKIFLELVSGDFSCSPFVPDGPLNGRIYVNRNAIAYPDGETWISAYRTLGDAINESDADPMVLEIWVAEGTYPVTSAAQRDSSFTIDQGVSIYGGFSGTETSITQRDFIANPVILSGEIGDTNVITDNSYHVVVIENNADTVVLDGLTIRDGYADGPGHTQGGGMHAGNTNSGLLVIRNSVMEANYAIEGSSVYNASRTLIENSEILNDVIEGITGSSILNSGPLAIMNLHNSSVVQQCTNCPEVIQNINGGVISISNMVTIEKE